MQRNAARGLTGHTSRSAGVATAPEVRRCCHARRDGVRARSPGPRCAARPGGRWWPRRRAEPAPRLLADGGEAEAMQLRQKAVVVAGDRHLPGNGDAGAVEMLGDVQGAFVCPTSVLAICQSHGESWFFGWSQWALGSGQRKQGDRRAATARVKEGLKGLRRVGDALATGYCLDRWARSPSTKTDATRAATLLGAVKRLAYVTGTCPALFPEAVEVSRPKTTPAVDLTTLCTVETVGVAP